MMAWAPLKLKNLTNALNKVNDYEGLGVELDIGYHKLQDLFKGRSPPECKRAMLQCWLDSDTEASWEKLYSALKNMDLKGVAEEVRKEYQISSMPSKDACQQLPTVTTQSINFTTVDQPSILPTDQLELQLEIDKLVVMYDHLVEKTVVILSEEQEKSPSFFRKFRISVTVLPTSLKYQHKYFLEQHCSKIVKATTVEEIFSILNSDWDFLNYSLLAHIISKFGNEEVKEQLSSYTTSLQAFRSQTKIRDFMKAWTVNPNLSPTFVFLTTKMSSEWDNCTLEDVEEYRKSMAKRSSLPVYNFHFKGANQGCICLTWSVPDHAICFLTVAMNSVFLQQHSIEEVTIDGKNLDGYKHIQETEFRMIDQV